MNATIRKQIDALEKMRLNELQARYAEVIGEATRCPNKRWLVRKITEALEAARDAEDIVAADDDDETAVESLPAPLPEGTKLKDLSIDELQACYVATVQRPTRSQNRRYLIWKIREAQQGRIPVGPRRGRHANGEAPDFKVLPLRIEADLVAQLDEARERLGLKSRMDLFRRSLHAYLLEAGEEQVAELFAADA